MPIGNLYIELMKDDIPLAAVLSAVPMLCTRCAALAGCWITHHRRKATAAQLRTVLSFTAASLEAQSSPLCQLFPYLSPEPAWGGGPSQWACRAPDGCSMPGTSRRYACARVRVCRSRRKYAAPGRRTGSGDAAVTVGRQRSTAPLR